MFEIKFLHSQNICGSHFNLLQHMLAHKILILPTDCYSISTPKPLRLCRYFHQWHADGRVVLYQEKVSLGWISETVRCKMLILFRALVAVQVRF